jgi:hypothetical protein
MLRWRLSPYFARVTVHRHLVFALVILGAGAGWLVSVASPEIFSARDERMHSDPAISDIAREPAKANLAIIDQFNRTEEQQGPIVRSPSNAPAQPERNKISALRSLLGQLRSGMSDSEASRVVALKEMQSDVFCNHHWAYHSVPAAGYSLSLQFTDHGLARAQLTDPFGIVEVWPK